MEIKRDAIKHNAKLLIAQTRPSPIFVILAYLLIGLVLTELCSEISGMNKLLEEVSAEYQKGNMGYLPPMPELSASAWILLAAIAVLALLLFAGEMIYCLEVCQLRKGSVGNLFDGFALFPKVIGLFAMEIVFVYLWSLLLIVPGIIAAYRYRQALYLLLENPELGILDCMRQSSEMMIGHKWELFVLDFSFLGWFLLCNIPGVSIWVEPYTRITYTNYYLALRDMPQSTLNTTV